MGGDQSNVAKEGCGNVIGLPTHMGVSYMHVHESTIACMQTPVAIQFSIRT